MPFTDRFQLLDLKRDEGARTFEAREIATGRPVFVHLFVNRSSPLNRALLAKIDTLPEEERHRIIDRGDHESGLYVVTDRLAEYPGLREWLQAKNEHRPKPLDAGGAWQLKPPPLVVPPKLPVDEPPAAPFDTAPLPALEPSIASPPPVSTLGNSGVQTLQIPTSAEPPAAPASAVKEPGEFTRQFVPPVLRPAPPPTPKETPPPSAPAAKEPGEFTRQFVPGAFRRAPPTAPQETPPPSASAAKEPGEFTRQFVPPVLRPSPPTAPQETPPPSVPAAKEPGEFTRQFVPPVLRPSVPSVPKDAPAPREPGEFTRMFPATAPKPAAPQKPAPPPGEFTRQFQAPQRPVSAIPPKVGPPSQNAPPAREAGEFTQMLQAQRPAAPAPSVKQPSQSGEFTRYFESPMTPSAQGSPGHIAPPMPTRPPPHPKDAGEFTQIFGPGDMPSPPPPSTPSNPVNANATQVFATPRPAPQSPMAAPNTAPPMSPLQMQGPGEYTQMFAKPASLTFGQAPAGPPTQRAPEPAPIKRNSSRLPLLLVVGAVVLLIAAIVVYFVMRPHST